MRGAAGADAYATDAVLLMSMLLMLMGKLETTLSLTVNMKQIRMNWKAITQIFAEINIVPKIEAYHNLYKVGCFF